MRKTVTRRGIAAKIIAAIAALILIAAGVLTGKAVLAKRARSNRSGESYVDTAVKILIAIVIGALLLAGLYALFGDTVLPTLTRRIQEMFSYSG
jgi:multisubunit Na+/H+ antiporter MnhC subunit